VLALAPLAEAWFEPDEHKRGVGIFFALMLAPLGAIAGVVALAAGLSLAGRRRTLQRLQVRPASEDHQAPPS
jgi:hypothetical protein